MTFLRVRVYVLLMAVLQMLRHLLVERKTQFSRWWRWMKCWSGYCWCVRVFVCTRSAILNTSLNYIWIKYFKEESVEPDGNGIYLVWLVIDIVWCVDSVQHLRMRIQLYKGQKSNPACRNAIILGRLWSISALYAPPVFLCVFVNIFNLTVSI